MDRKVVVNIEANAENEIFRITGVTLKRDNGTVITLTPNEAYWLGLEFDNVNHMEEVFLAHPKFADNLDALDMFTREYKEKLYVDHIDEIEEIRQESMEDVFYDTSNFDEYRNEEEDEDDE